ncbi:MAG: LPS export ABC transporter permease LptG [Hyphomicrobiaceae bacterium]|nr:LPS export ABC transporter permease LptG [Hyphomicrobiaceae bacterium]
MSWFGLATIDRYLVRRFATGIFGAFLICSLLIYMIDMVELLRLSGKYGAVKLYHLAWLALLRLPAYTEFLVGFAVQVGSIGALLMLSRKSELTIMRASGMSVWRFLRPAMLVALLIGVVSTAIYNPMAAWARTEGEQFYAELFGRETNLLGSDNKQSWLRQDGLDGQSVIGAAAAADRGLKLTTVTAFVYDRAGRFVERVDARAGNLKEGYWELDGVWVTRPGEEPQAYGSYLLSTYLSPERVADALGSVYAVSFWELPALIEVAEKAALSTTRLALQYEALLARPLLCVAMVLLAATVSLKSFRSGGIQTMVVSGMVGGFGFFLLAEVSRQLGSAGLAPVWAAVWLPICLAILVSLTVLMHQEDG